MDQWAKNVSSGEEQGCNAQRLQAHLAAAAGTQDTKAQNQEGNNVRVSVHFLALGSQSLLGRAAVPFSLQACLNSH